MPIILIHLDTNEHLLLPIQTALLPKMDRRSQLPIGTLEMGLAPAEYSLLYRSTALHPEQPPVTYRRPEVLRSDYTFIYSIPVILP